MVNVRRATAQTPSVTSLDKGEAHILEHMVDQLPSVPDTLIVGSQKAWLREPIRQASTPMVGAIFPQNRDSYVELVPNTPTEVQVLHHGPRLVPKPGKSQSVLKHIIAHVAEHSLQMVAQEFKKIQEAKVYKLKGGYLANATLLVNSWLKDIDMCV